MFNKSQFVKDLKELVAFQTLPNNIGEQIKALDFIESKIKPPARITRLVNKGVPMLLASNHATKSPDVLYLVHADVVHADEGQFKLEKSGDVITGRGVSDMKFSIPIGVALLQQLIIEKSSLSFCFAVTTDEEVGGFDGAKYLADTYKLRPKLLIVPDGGDNFVFVKRAKGVCQLRIQVKGRAAHASQPWEGKNAIALLSTLVVALGKKYPITSGPTARPTLNIGVIRGGVSVNQVCAEAEMHVDVRFFAPMTSRRVEREISVIAKKIDPEISVALLAEGEATETDLDDPIVRLFLSTMETTLKRKLTIQDKFGSSDARHFSRLGIPVLMTKPIGGKIHGPDEHISLAACEQYHHFLECFLNEYQQKLKGGEKKHGII